MTCNLSKFILVLEHLKVSKVTPITPYNWKKYQVTLFGGENILGIIFSCLEISMKIIFHQIKLDLSISIKCNYAVILSEKLFKRRVKLSFYCVWPSIDFKTSDLTFLHYGYDLKDKS